jgi:hypothetical protein
MNALTREQFLAFKPRPPVPVAIPGGTIHVRTMNGSQRERFERIVRSGDDRNDVRASLIAMTACDAEGRPLFTAADIPAINALDASILMPIHDAAIEANRITPDQVEELAGN